MNDLEKWIVARLKRAGVDGIDSDELEEEAFEEDQFGLKVGDDFESVVARLCEQGLVEEFGCSWVRLSMREWGRIIAQAAGVDDFAEIFESLLRGAQ